MLKSSIDKKSNFVEKNNYLEKKLSPEDFNNMSKAPEQNKATTEKEEHILSNGNKLNENIIIKIEKDLKRIKNRIEVLDKKEQLNKTKQVLPHIIPTEIIRVIGKDLKDSNSPNSNHHLKFNIKKSKDHYNNKKEKLFKEDEELVKKLNLYDIESENIFTKFNEIKIKNEIKSKNKPFVEAENELKLNLNKKINKSIFSFNFPNENTTDLPISYRNPSLQVSLSIPKPLISPIVKSKGHDLLNYDVPVKITDNPILQKLKQIKNKNEYINDYQDVKLLNPINSNDKSRNFLNSYKINIESTLGTQGYQQSSKKISLSNSKNNFEKNFKNTEESTTVFETISNRKHNQNYNSENNINSNEKNPVINTHLLKIAFNNFSNEILSAKNYNKIFLNNTETNSLSLELDKYYTNNLKTKSLSKFSPQPLANLDVLKSYNKKVSINTTPTPKSLSKDLESKFEIIQIKTKIERENYQNSVNFSNNTIKEEKLKKNLSDEMERHDVLNLKYKNLSINIENINYKINASIEEVDTFRVLIDIKKKQKMELIRVYELKMRNPKKKKQNEIKNTKLHQKKNLDQNLKILEIPQNENDEELIILDNLEREIVDLTSRKTTIEQDILKDKYLKESYKQDFETTNELLDSSKKLVKTLKTSLELHFHELLFEGTDTRYNGLTWIIIEIWNLGMSVFLSYLPKFLDPGLIEYLFISSHKQVELKKCKELLSYIKSIFSTLKGIGYRKHKKLKIKEFSKREVIF